MKYNHESIKQLEPLDHIRQRPGMYVGDLSSPIKLLYELIDNSTDEIQNYKNTSKLFVEIDNVKHHFIVADNGRGIPFNEKVDVLQDSAVMIFNDIFTSGKFGKDKDDSSYKISSGLNGVGLTICHALSEKLLLEINRDKKNIKYCFEYNKVPVRQKSTAINKKSLFSTIIYVKPKEEFYDTLNIDPKIIEEKLNIISLNFPNVDIILKVNGVSKKIIYKQENLLNDIDPNYLKNTLFNIKLNKEEESSDISFWWNLTDNISPKEEYFSTVNFVKTIDGYHITKLRNIIKSVLSKYGKKYKFEFDDSDCLNWFRFSFDLRIVDVHFDSQTKDRLSKKTNLSILDEFEKDLDKLVKNNIDKFKEIFERFEIYRKSLQNKKSILTKKGKKRGFSSFTKLRDCTKPGGEFYIGEGESAISGLVGVRDPSRHAILPLMGVPLNVLNYKNEDIMKNVEIKDILNAIGTGTVPNFDMSLFRYDKIIIAADADPAGEHITALLITLFAKLTPELIKNGKIYECVTPLYGYGYKKSFKPIWSEEELEEKRKEGIKIRRFKGLGEFDPDELYVFTLSEKTRKLRQVIWSEKYKRIFELLHSKGTAERKLLALGKWVL